MIYDTLDHAGQYRGLSGNLAKALDYLTGTELETVEAGRVEIDGERVFALLFPQDAHAPCIAAGECRPVRKVVLKVAVEPAE